MPFRQYTPKNQYPTRGKEETPISIRYFSPRRRRSHEQYLPSSVDIPNEIIERLKVETALELGVSDYQNRFKGDYPATVHAQISKYFRLKIDALVRKIEEDPSVIDIINNYIKQEK